MIALLENWILRRADGLLTQTLLKKMKIAADRSVSGCPTTMNRAGAAFERA
jgi:hypothetical protein